MHQKFRDGLLMSAIVLACVGALELGARAVGLANDPTTVDGGLKRILSFDDVLETRYRPKAETRITSPYGEFDTVYQTNELGLRDRPFEAEKAEGEFRILAVGNSFVEGWGVAEDQRFSTVAERIANQRLGGRLRIVNAGISGYGAAQSLLQAKVLADKSQADAIVLVLVGTMVSADHNYLSRATLNANGIAEGLDATAVFAAPSEATGRAPVESGAPAWLMAMAKVSVLARFAAQRLANRSAMDRVVPGDPMTDMLAAYRPKDGSLLQLLEPTLRHVRALEQAAAREGRKFALVYLPMPFQLSAVEWAEGRKAFRLSESIEASAEVPIIERFCREGGTACYFANGTLAQRVARSSSQERQYFNYDFHLNSRGNAVVGEWLSGHLVPMVRPE